MVAICCVFLIKVRRVTCWFRFGWGESFQFQPFGKETQGLPGIIPVHERCVAALAGLTCQHKPIMNNTRLPALLYLVMLAFGVLHWAQVYPQLPDRMASHFSANGTPNGWQ